MGERGRPSSGRFALLAGVSVVAVVIASVFAPVAAAAPANERTEAVISAALEYLGRPYRLGAEGPNQFDCSGFVYRAFSDAGQARAIGNARLRAAGYLRWFERRGLVTEDESQAERGDLIVYADGEHIGIYLGRGEVVSALSPSGITVHRVHGLNYAYSHVLKVDWGSGGPPPPTAEDDGGSDEEAAGGDEASGAQDEESEAEGLLGVTTGSLNLRTAPDPAAPAVGVVSRGATFTVVGAERSASGSVWLNVETSTGQAGWIWSQFASVPEGTDLEALADVEPESVGVATGALNLRAGPDPASEIVGWIGQGSSFRILGGANSPGGWLWLNVETESGVTGWVWSYWTEYAEEALAASEAAAGEPTTQASDAATTETPTSEAAGATEATEATDADAEPGDAVEATGSEAGDAAATDAAEAAVTGDPPSPRLPTLD